MRILLFIYIFSKEKLVLKEEEAASHFDLLIFLFGVKL